MNRTGLAENLIPSAAYRVPRPKRPGQLTQALDVQDKLLARIKDDKVTDRDLASLATAWDRAADRVRIIRMRAKPRDADVPVGGRGFRGGKVLPAPVEDLRPGAAPACCAGPGEPDSIGAKA